MQKKNNQAGIAKSRVLLIIATLIIIGILAYLAYASFGQKGKDQAPSANEPTTKEEVNKESENNSSDEERVKAFLKENISELSPKKEELGGKFYITDFRFADDQSVEIDYEDGHIAVRARVTYTMDQAGVYVQRFTIIGREGEKGFNSSSTESVVPANDPLDADYVLSELKRLIAEKYGESLNRVIVQVTDDRKEFLKGNMHIVGDERVGYFFAKRSSDKLILEYAEMGKFACAPLAAYPADMIEGCEK